MSVSALPSRNTDVDTLLEMISALTERVAALEAPQRARTARDELDERIVAFFTEHAKLRFPAGAVAENLGEDTRVVGARVDALARAKRIDSEKRPAKVRVYFAKAGA